MNWYVDPKTTIRGHQIDMKAFDEAAEVVKASYGIKGY
jgi:hypothetical protein